MAESQLITRYKAENSDFLKKTKEAGRALDQFGMKGTEVGNKISQITNLLNINVGALSKLAVGLGAAGAAAKVAGDAFFKNEANLDEWGRKVESTKSVYNGFLNALNNGDISGYLSNISTIIQAARDAYDAMDELGTYNAFSQREVARNKAGYTEALDAYKLNPNAANKEALENANAKVIDDLTEAQAKTENSYREGLQKLAAERGLSAQQQQRFVELFSSGNYTDLKNAKSSYSTGTGFHMFDQLWNGNQVINGKIRENNSWRLMTDMEKDQFEFARALSQTNDKEIEAIQKEGAKALALSDAISQQNKSFNRMAGNYSTGGGKGGDTPAAVGSMDEIKQKITELNKQLSAAVTDEARQNILSLIDEAEQKLRGMQAATKGSGLDLSSGRLGARTDNYLGIYTPEKKEVQKVIGTQGVHDQLAEAASKMDISGIDRQAKELEKAFEASRAAIEDWDKKMSAANQLVSSLNGLKQGFNGLGIDLGKGFDEVTNTLSSVITIIQSVQGIVSAIQMFTAGNDATQTALLSAISVNTGLMAANSFTGYIPFLATGGRIPRAAGGYNGEIGGNRYSGDQQLIAVNAGEYVFNRAQLGALASQLSQQSDGRKEVEFRISGQELVGILRQESFIKSYR